MTEEERGQIHASLDEASKQGLFRSVDVRPQIKLQADAPKIVIAIPMGDKDDPDLFVCEGCGHRHFGAVKCARCGAEGLAEKRLRHAGLVPIEWLLNAWQIVPPLLCAMQIMVRKSVLSAQARNEMTAAAIEHGAKYIFYWDDDTIIPPKAIYDLHNAMERTPDAAIITGVYTTREPLPEPLVYKHQGQGAYWDFDTTPGNLEEIYAAGAGCMMARIDALKEIEATLGGPWWVDEQDMDAHERGEGRILWGHDIRFCRRAIEAGRTGKTSQEWKVYLAGWVQCYHFDVPSQTMYALPSDAPCFKNKNTASYWDYLWKAEGHGTGRLYPELYARVLEEVPAESNLVDVGCGIGIFMDMAVKKKRVRAYGYDISAQAIEHLKERWLDGEVCDVRDFKLNHFPAGETVVVSTETIEHLDDARFAYFLGECQGARRVILTTPDGKLEGTPEGEHVQEFTQESLSERLTPHFRVVTVHKVEPHYLMAVCEGGGT